MTSLATKLGLRPGQTVRLLEGRGEAFDLLTAALPAGVELLYGEGDTPRCDQLFFWPRSLSGLAERFVGLQWCLVPDGSLWVVMPKKAFAIRHEHRLQLGGDAGGGALDRSGRQQDRLDQR